MSELRKGFTTGVHASFAFRSALEVFLRSNYPAISFSTKMDNDDLDVTKGCVIVARVSDSKEDLELNPLKHKPYSLQNRIFLYAGRGVGVVTKEGLKVPKGYPAINPTPLKAIEQIAKKYEITKPIFASIGVIDGEKIAKETANERVGVLGGLSILGTSGIVKPISSDAYLKSIEVELDVMVASGIKRVVFTLGNSSKLKALKSYREDEIIEIGNFIYDGISLAFEKGLDVILYIGIAKAVKIAQGAKNTHNRFGSIDFKRLGDWIGRDLDGLLTVKRVVELVDRDSFYFEINSRARKQILEWFGKEIEIVIV